MVWRLDQQEVEAFKYGVGENIAPDELNVAEK
jgi:hypothetical protein